MTNEQWYDKEIAPELMRMGKLCEARGMSFLCQVEYARDETSEIKAVVAGAGIKTVIARAGIECHGNVDSLIWAIKRYAVKHGHQSIELQLMGIPATPAVEDPNPLDPGNQYFRRCLKGHVGYSISFPECPSCKIERERDV